jgi:hypothetical protein
MSQIMQDDSGNMYLVEGTTVRPLTLVTPSDVAALARPSNGHGAPRLADVLDAGAPTLTLESALAAAHATLGVPAGHPAAKAKTTRMTKNEHRLATAIGLLRAAGQDTTALEAALPARAPKAVPSFIVDKAKNSEARKALAKALRDAGRGAEVENPAQWQAAKKAAGIV